MPYTTPNTQLIVSNLKISPKTPVKRSNIASITPVTKLSLTPTLPNIGQIQKLQIYFNESGNLDQITQDKIIITESKSDEINDQLMKFTSVKNDPKK